jgi:SMC interacting uncharacterized protein involved in chromosome segregation
MVFYVLQAMFFHYIKCFAIYNSDRREDIDAEDSYLAHEMEKKLNISDSESLLIEDKINNLKTQLEDPEEAAARAEMRELDAAAADILNDSKKQQDCIQKRIACRSEWQDKIKKLSSDNDMLDKNIEKLRADISRMKHVVDNQSISPDDKKRIESECRQLEEAFQMNWACCDAFSKTVYADELKIAKMKNEWNSKCIAHNTSILEHRNNLPELDALKMPMNFLHRDTVVIMQVKFTLTIQLAFLYLFPEGMCSILCPETG